ncbi:MAG: hypothetical protein KAW01_04170, partial [Deltaproteobacteria bacterium]|nr:hypothetical protein [Deltaproteobacteria bacterium]
MNTDILEPMMPETAAAEKSPPDLDLDDLELPPKVKDLIENGSTDSHLVSKDADLAVCITLTKADVPEAVITDIFNRYPIGENYRESGDSQYLEKLLKNAREKIHLNSEEVLNPLYLRGVIAYDDKGNKKLHIKKFQEYLADYQMMKFVENGASFIRYNGKCYDFLPDVKLNHLCQEILDDDRELFGRCSVKDLTHFGVGGEFYDEEKTVADQLRYLTVGNGLYDIKNRELIPHTHTIFSTNLLPYDYDSSAICSRWLQYLDEVALGDQGMINCLQEAAGYIFCMSIPKPALFFLVGSGANGKSVFLNILTELVGKNNSCSVNLNLLSQEYYIRELQNKMVNISTETPRNRQTTMNQVKAICAGDIVTGRSIYDRPVQFKPFAKHFLAMNELPAIEDMTFGMQRRLYIFNFSRTFTEQEMDVNLHEKLCTELPGIFNWALDGLRRLMENNYIFSRSQRMEQIKNE